MAEVAMADASEPPTWVRASHSHGGERRACGHDDDSVIISSVVVFRDVEEGAQLAVGLALNWLAMVMCLVVVIAWLTVGVRRWVRFVIAAIMLDGLVAMFVTDGVGGPLALVAVFLGLNLVGTLLIARGWRVPRVLAYVPASLTPWPDHAEKEIVGWTVDLERLGFERVADVVSTWSWRGAARVTKLRFLRQPAENAVAVLYAGAKPKSIGRTLRTELAGGWLTTEDRVTDAMLFSAPGHEEQRVPAASTTDAMLVAHRARARHLDVVALNDDALVVGARCRNGWIEGLLASGQLRADGDLVALTLQSAFRSRLRTLALWFS
jgi:hypothetical protein